MPVKYNTDKGTPEQRVADRLKNSGGDHADHVIQKGSGPTRSFTNIHERGHQTGRGVPDFGSEMPGPMSKKDQGK
jgi:hypothetical protein